MSKKLTVTRLNTSFSYVDAELEVLQSINDYLKVERPGAYFDPLVKAGFKSPYDFFTSVQNEKLLIQNGHLQLLSGFGISAHELISDYSSEELDVFLKDMKEILPYTPYDFQINAFRDSILNVVQINRMCTSSGKSMTISLIAEFFRRKGLKGLLLVPNINLLTQFKGDIKEYNLHELFENTNTIGGGNTDKNFDAALTISTWQSLSNHHDDLDSIDYIICDELHRFASTCTSEIIKQTVLSKFKFGFTGTLPEDPVAKMQLFGLFNLPKTYITSKELIERGLGTPIHVNKIQFNYPQEAKALFKSIREYPKQVKFIKEYEPRNKFIVNLCCKLKNKTNNLILFQHTEHGKLLFIETMKKLYPDVIVLNKNITGKKSFEFQEQYGIYFLNGEDDAKTREKTRNILEDHEESILFANYAILSTGVSIKRLHNMVLASPLKAYTTVTQSIGRLMRLHKDKKIANVYDLVDNFGFRKPGGIFYKQYIHRRNTSYNTEDFPITEAEINL